TFERPIYAGNAIQVVKSRDAKKVFTIRTASFDAAGIGGNAPVTEAALLRTVHIGLGRIDRRHCGVEGLHGVGGLAHVVAIADRDHPGIVDHKE
ncbi:hypothetical protein VB636_00125, partial [Paracoccus sp. APAP_BH8]